MRELVTIILKALPTQFLAGWIGVHTSMINGVLELWERSAIFWMPAALMAVLIYLWNEAAITA